MAKLTLSDVSNINGNPASAATTLNANAALIETAVENTLSRDGTAPNAMQADLDMNSNRILNLPDATSAQEPVTLAQAGVLSGGGTVQITETNFINNPTVTADGPSYQFVDSGASVDYGHWQLKAYTDTGQSYFSLQTLDDLDALQKEIMVFAYRSATGEPEYFWIDGPYDYSFTGPAAGSAYVNFVLSGYTTLDQDYQALTFNLGLDNALGAADDCYATIKAELGDSGNKTLFSFRPTTQWVNAEKAYAGSDGPTVKVLYSSGLMHSNLQGTTQQGWEIGWKEIPRAGTISAYPYVAPWTDLSTFTCDFEDSGKFVLHPSGAGAGDNVKIPSNAACPYPIGTVLTFVNRDSNAFSIQINTDTMYLAGTTTTGTRTLAENGVATAIKVESTVWIISGSGLT